MDFRQYLRLHRDTRNLKLILEAIGQGILELHDLGYVHRDLKPDNVVLNLRPLMVKIIDFDRS
jgi:serine/threonine protein kinase